MKIAWLGLLDSDEVTASTRAQVHLSNLARQVVAASDYAWSIDLISCSRHPGCHRLAQGIQRVVLPVAGHPRTVWDRISWALPAAISSADLIHLHDGFSRSCEMALLIAKQAHKPVCMTEWGLDGYWLSAELDLRELADTIVCHDASVAHAVTSSKPVELVPCNVDIRQIGVPTSWPANQCTDSGSRAELPADEEYVTAGAALCGVYRRLVASPRRAAA
jgi:hypothetical protein